MVRRALVLVPLLACSSTDAVAPADGGTRVDDAGTDVLAQVDAGMDAMDGAADSGPVKPASNIEHLVVVIQENHTFDAYFGRWCTAPAGSNPTCNTGPACCEAGPATEPGGAMPVVLDDASNGAFDPNHGQACGLDEIDNGAMDRFVSGTLCGDPKNFAYASATTVAGYTALAANNALADRWFHSVPGASSSNDVFFARAAYLFADNLVQPKAVGSSCYPQGFSAGEFSEPTIADLLDQRGVSWGFYAEGYQKMVDAAATCPAGDPECPTRVNGYPCNYDPGDVPFAFFPRVRDTGAMRDYSTFTRDLAAGTLPSVVFVKAIGFRTEHPGSGITISAGVQFVKAAVAAVAGSPLASSTLLLVTFDEGGGYFDHVPPPKSSFDRRSLGTRVPTIAIGRFAKKGFVSHTPMEHSSVVKFIEWNWLGSTGQLGTRDTTAANIGSLLDPNQTGVAVPEG